PIPRPSSASPAVISSANTTPRATPRSEWITLAPRQVLGRNQYCPCRRARRRQATLRLSLAGFLQQIVAEPPDVSLTQAEAVADIGVERAVLPVDRVEGCLKIGFLHAEQSPHQSCELLALEQPEQQQLEAAGGKAVGL